MVTGIDLKPLTDETIAQMGYNNHDLWMVKIGSIVFGPYETESLKHYVHDNEHLFEEALASRADETEWKPFWIHTKFSRRKPQLAAGERHEGPFWLMDFGMKVGPFSYRDIDKKIEMGLLVMTDHISIDEGQTWHKIYQIEGFDRRTHSPDELPLAPFESSFEKAKLLLVEKLEQPHVNPSEEFAEMCWSANQMGKVIEFKVEEIPFRQEKQTHVSNASKWFLPTVAGLALTVTTSVYFMFQSGEEEVIVAEETSSEKPFYQGKNRRIPRPSGMMPSPSSRTPASASYGQPSQVYNESRYPTHIETHEEYGEPAPEPDPLDGPVTDVEQQPAEVHSLVGNQPEPGPEQSLDQAMNGGAPEQPVVEEASDF